MRSAVLFIHRWVGITVLFFLAIAAITGAIIAFNKELDRAINPEWNYVTPTGARLSLNDLVAKMHERFPEARVTYVRIDEPEDRSFRFLVSRKPGDGEGTKLINQQVFVNPYDGEILGTRRSGTFSVDRPNLIPFLSKLHYTLFLGDFGKWLMGFVALAWLIDHFGAAYLSFPNLKNWKKSFLLRWRSGGYKLNFDLHRAGGLWFFPILFVLALTSVELNLKAPFVWVVSQFSSLTSKNCVCHVDPNANWAANTSSWDGAVDLARNLMPNLSPSSVMFYPDEGKFRISMRGPDDISDAGMTYVYINAVTGKQLMVFDRSDETGGDTFMAWMYPLHNGRAFGLAGQIVISLTGILLTVICVTGLVIYFKKLGARKAGRQLRLKQQTTAAAPALENEAAQ